MNVNDVRACRLCLLSDVRMFVIDSSSEECLKTFLGQNISYTSGLPRYTCYECTALLSRIKKFRSKCLVAQTVLYSIIKLQNVITEKQIKLIDRKKLNLQSTLKIQPGNILSSDTNENFIDDCQLDESNNENREDVLNGTNCIVKIEAMDFEHVYTNDTRSDDDDDNSSMSTVNDNIENLPEQKNEYVTKSGRIVKPSREKCKIEKVQNKKLLLKGRKKRLQAARGNEKLPSKQHTNKFKFLKEYKLKEQEDLDKEFIVTLLSIEEQKAEIEKRKESDGYKNAEFKCELCYKDFPDENRLKEHMNYHNPKFGEFSCEVCLVRCRAAAALAQHAGSHAARYQCRRCAFTTTKRDLARTHLEWHVGVKSEYQCDYCGQCFRKPYTLYTHFRIKHSSKVQTNSRRRQRSNNNPDTASDSSETDEGDSYNKDVPYKNRKSLKRHRNASSVHGGKSHTCKKYSEEALTLACEAVRAGMKRSTAGKAYGVPRSTLWDYLKDPSRTFKARRGPTPLLTGEEEDNLARWVVTERVNKKQLKNKVREMLEGDERLERFSASEKWIRLFISRHPETRPVLLRV